MHSDRDSLVLCFEFHCFQPKIRSTGFQCAHNINYVPIFSASHFSCIHEDQCRWQSIKKSCFRCSHSSRVRIYVINRTIFCLFFHAARVFTSFVSMNWLLIVHALFATLSMLRNKKLDSFVCKSSQFRRKMDYAIGRIDSVNCEVSLRPFHLSFQQEFFNDVRS